MILKTTPLAQISRIFSFFAVVAVAASCSNDDEPEPNIEDAALSFSQDTPLLEVPQGLMASEDPYAQMAAGWVTMANGMSANLALFTPPAGAARSTELIVPANGRVASSEGVVYTWSDPSYGSVAYQIRDANDRYIFELLYKGPDDTAWYRYLHAEEKKDRSSGFMTLYDAWGTVDETREKEMLTWSWTRKGDQFTFEMVESESGMAFTVSVNTKTKAGSIVYFEQDMKLFEIAWDGQGKGSWKEYEAGELVAEGSWE